MFQSRRFLVGAGCFLLAVFLAACGRVVKPVDIRVTGMLISMDTADVGLIVTNPNSFALDILSAEYRITIGEDRCGSGRRDTPIHVGARDSAPANVLLAVDYASIARSLPSLLTDTVVVKLDGNYRVRTALGPKRLDFRAERRIAVKDQVRSLLDGLFDGE